MAYGDFKYLPRRAASDKVLHHKAFNIAKNPKYDWYQRDLVSVIFDKNSVATRANKFATHIEKEINSEIQQLP